MNKKSFKEKRCNKCSSLFFPTGGKQKFCSTCRKESDKPKRKYEFTQLLSKQHTFAICPQCEKSYIAYTDWRGTVTPRLRCDQCKSLLDSEEYNGEQIALSNNNIPFDIDIYAVGIRI